MLKRGGKQRFDLVFVCHIAHHAGEPRVLCQGVGQGRRINVADVDPGAGAHKILGRGQADALGRRGDQHALFGVAVGSLAWRPVVCAGTHVAREKNLTTDWFEFILHGAGRTPGQIPRPKGPNP